MSADRPQRALVLTSASPREGKTTVTLSLAISLAQSGKRVLLVDTDLRKPRVHKALERSNAKGVTTVLVGAHTAKEAIQTTDVPGVDLLASGPIPPNPAELLHTAQFRDLVAELRTRYDIVLFDSPPLNAVTDAAIIAPQVDGVVMIIHGQRTTRDAARSAMRQLRDVNANITGGVLNDVDLSSRQYGYGSYYYYHHDGYYSAEAEEHAPAAEA
jgi:capsular exopolysaccharide synthesis family protein